MKCYIPEISWHGRDPVLSIDFQMLQGTVRRLATGGTDTHVLIWLVSLTSGSKISLEFASDLTRHTKPVNVVRFSPNGEILASGDDEASIILWKQQERDNEDLFNEEPKENKEQWTPLKMLRGHLDDVSDLCWSADSNFMISGSVDNTSIIWDIQKGKSMSLFSDSKGFVQGVAWDPMNQYIASLSSDRSLRIYNVQGKRVLYKVQKALVSTGTEQDKAVPGKLVRIFYDDTLKSFCRRLTFSPDGELLFVPSGIIELEDGKILNTTYVFPRHSLNKPALHLPSGNKYTLAVRCSPILYELRRVENNPKKGDNEVEEQPKSLFSLPYRIVFAVATKDSVLLYDTQQAIPFGYVGNIHYTHLTDLTWSPDGRILMVSSTDGYCSFIIFAEGEIGQPYKQTTNSLKDENLIAPSKDSNDSSIATSQLPTTSSVGKEKRQKMDTSGKEQCKKATPEQQKIDVTSSEPRATALPISNNPELNETTNKGLPNNIDDMDIDFKPAKTVKIANLDLCTGKILQPSDRKMDTKNVINVNIIDETANLEPKEKNEPMVVDVISEDWQLVLEPSHDTAAQDINTPATSNVKVQISPASPSPHVKNEKPTVKKAGRRVQLITLSGKTNKS